MPAHAEDLHLDVPSARRSESSAGQNSGGLFATQEMRDILSQPGYLSLAKGGKKLRNIYMQRKLHSNILILKLWTSSFPETSHIDPTKLSHFGLCCFIGALSEVQQV